MSSQQLVELTSHGGGGGANGPGLSVAAAQQPQPQPQQSVAAAQVCGRVPPALAALVRMTSWGGSVGACSYWHSLSIPDSLPLPAESDTLLLGADGAAQQRCPASSRRTGSEAILCAHRHVTGMTKSFCEGDCGVVLLDTLLLLSHIWVAVVCCELMASLH